MKYDICVFGGCSLDQTYYLDENGVIPKNPDVIAYGGKGANQAVAASRAGARVTIITRLGKDEIGQKILENLVYNGISTNNVEVVEGLENDYAKILIDAKEKDNVIERFGKAIDSFTPDMIDRYKKVILNSKIVVAQMKVPKEVSIELINFCYENNKPIIITPCRPAKLAINEPGNKELIDKITLITANRTECETIFGTTDIEKCVRRYPNKLIVTLGSEGVMYHNGTSIVHIPALKVPKVVDSTGAGDTFNGNLAAALADNHSLHDAILRAQYASSMKIQEQTAQQGMPFKEELDNYIMNYVFNSSDYMSEFDLAYRSIMEASENIENAKINPKKKDDLTFVTESDYKIEKKLIDNIRELYPKDNFVTEEFNSTNTIKERTWIIDPIDGTHHYMKKSIFWGIQLAFIDKGEIQFSIIYLPKLNEIYYGVKDRGVYLNHKKININKNIPFNENIIEFCGSMNKMYEEKKELFEMILKSDIKPGNYMHINSCCFAFSNLLSERTNTLVLSTKKPWDILPGIFLVEEAGFNKYNFKELVIYTNNKEIEKFLI